MVQLSSTWPSHRHPWWWRRLETLGVAGPWALYHMSAVPSDTIVPDLAGVSPHRSLHKQRGHRWPRGRMTRPPWAAQTSLVARPPAAYSAGWKQTPTGSPQFFFVFNWSLGAGDIVTTRSCNAGACHPSPTPGNEFAGAGHAIVHSWRCFPCACLVPAPENCYL